MKFLQLVRWKNLIIIAATQFLIAFTLLYPILNIESIPATMNQLEIGLVVFITVLISAGGYIINDIFDQAIDLINKPKQAIIGKYISKKAAYQIYGLLGLTGLILTLYISYTQGRWIMTMIYLVAWGMLWAYSHSFKKSPLFGNVIVSIFCAFVPGVLLIAEWPALLEFAGNGIAAQGFILYLIYILFAFLSTLIREVIKDMEDIDGDKKEGCRTLPIVWGINRTKGVVLVFTVMLIGILGYFASNLGVQGWTYSLLWTILTIILPLGYLLFKLPKAEDSADFRKLSTLMKIIMLTGLVLLIVFRLEVL